MSESPKEQVHFYCADCKVGWECVPDRVVDNPAAPWHPFDYYATREGCQCRREKRQAVWERNLLKAHAHATGPTTEEGKRAVTKNLEGHPTPEEARITRLNGLKHGLYAKTAPYFPARPGKYPHCETCEHLNNGCNEQNFRLEGHKNPPACLKRVELHMQHMIAFEQKNPDMLTRLAAELQARVHAIVDNMILAILNTGAEVRTPEWHFDKDGDFHLVDFIDDEGNRVIVEKISAHPLIKPLVDLLKANGMTLPDSGMTLRSQEETDALRGFLEDKGQPEQVSDLDRRQVEAIEKLAGMIENSQRAVQQDPVYVQHKQEEIEHE